MTTADSWTTKPSAFALGSRHRDPSGCHPGKVTDDDGWLARMSGEERARFLAETQRFLVLHAELKSVGEAAVLERAVVDPQDPVQARAYWTALSAHFARLANAHGELAEVTASMATALDSQYG